MKAIVRTEKLEMEEWGAKHLATEFWKTTDVHLQESFVGESNKHFRKRMAALETPNIYWHGRPISPRVRVEIVDADNTKKDTIEITRKEWEMFQKFKNNLQEAKEGISDLLSEWEKHSEFLTREFISGRWDTHVRDFEFPEFKRSLNKISKLIEIIEENNFNDEQNKEMVKVTILDVSDGKL